MKNSTVIGIKTNLDYKFFRYWVEFLTPLHHINKRDADVLASLLFERYKLSKVITDENLIPPILLSTEYRKKISEEQKMTVDHFNESLKLLRKKNAIINNDVNPKFIPRFTNDEKDYKLIIHFDFYEN